MMRFPTLHTARRRLVRALKWGLLGGAGVLLLLLLIWPQWSEDGGRFYLDYAKMAPDSIGQLAMVNADYQGVDRNNRPYSIQAATARQDAEQDTQVLLTRPRAEFYTGSGRKVYLEADEGTYFRDLNILELLGNVTLYHEDGYQIHTRSALADIKNNSAEGQDPVEGYGPQGNLQGEGFRIQDGGQSVMVLGQSQSQFRKESSEPQGRSQQGGTGQ